MNMHIRKVLLVIQRILAAAIDVILIVAISAGLLVAATYIVAHFNPSLTAVSNGASAFGQEGIALSLAPYVLVALPVIWLLYETLLCKIWGGTTIGKFLLRVRTVSIAGNLTTWQVLFRTTLKILSAGILMSIANPYALVTAIVVYLSFPILTAKSQFISDLLASTTVRRRSDATPG